MGGFSFHRISAPAQVYAVPGKPLYTLFSALEVLQTSLSLLHFQVIFSHGDRVADTNLHQSHGDSTIAALEPPSDKPTRHVFGGVIPPQKLVLVIPSIPAAP